MLQDQDLRVRETRITLTRGGKGPTLLYLHGPDGASSVRPAMELLARKHEVLVPEHPGFGGSDEPEWLDNIHDLAYFYLDFCEQLDLRNVHLVGSSLGGWLALEMAVRDRARLTRLTLAAPLGIHVPGVKRGDPFLWSPEEKARHLGDASIDVKNQYTFARLAWEPRLFDPHLAKWLHRVKVPTQIIWGERDPLLPSAYAAEFQKLIAGSRVDIVKDCGHLPALEKPEQFARLVEEFGR